MVSVGGIDARAPCLWQGGAAGDRRNEAAKYPARNTRRCRAATHHPGQSGRRGALQYGVRASNAVARKSCGAENLREEAVSCANPFMPDTRRSERPLRARPRNWRSLLLGVPGQPRQSEPSMWRRCGLEVGLRTRLGLQVALRD